MKLSITKAELNRGLSRIQAIVEKRNSMPILANVLIEARLPEEGQESGSLELAATDLEVGIRGIHPAQVEKAGSLTISAKKLFEITRELPDELIYLEATANSYLGIKCARAKFTLAGTAAEEYPTLPVFTPERIVPIPAIVLSQMIEQTMYAASVDETRYNLNGVYLEVIDGEQLRMVATDGHRLACVDRVVGAEVAGLASGVIIPRKGLAELKRLVDEDDAGEIELAFEGNNGLARRGNVTLVMRLIEGEFPNYDQVIPKQLERQIVIASDPLLHALRRVSLLSSERSRAVTLSLSDGKLVISSSNPDLGDAQEELDVDYAGEALNVGFNSKYLIDALGSSGAKEVRFGLNDDLSPAQLVPTDAPGTLAVVMPMRI